ncbi:30S ribosomal protein S4 [Acidobacteriia bacterium AH_259_A11_L15]|nr:30S ribosomal protein S4 [Acidobacteriia bacterium AH_259_A11_L15]
MARYREAVCRLCRRETMKLYLKGERCFTEKCAIEKRNVPPGSHGRDRRRRPGAYAEQLRAKQRVRRVYGVLERQFRRAFQKAERLPGKTGENLLVLLERRLDTVVRRAGFAGSQAQARQLVMHGHVRVNARKVNIPSFQVSVNDEIILKDKMKENDMVLQARELVGRQMIPSWLEVDPEAGRAKLVALPKREELITPPLQEQLIVELYSK